MMLGFDAYHLANDTDNNHDPNWLAFYIAVISMSIASNVYCGYFHFCELNKSIPLLYDIAGFIETIRWKMDCEIKTPHLFSIAEKSQLRTVGPNPLSLGGMVLEKLKYAST